MNLILFVRTSKFKFMKIGPHHWKPQRLSPFESNMLHKGFKVHIIECILSGLLRKVSPYFSKIGINCEIYSTSNFNDLNILFCKSLFIDHLYKKLIQSEIIYLFDYHNDISLFLKEQSVRRFL